ncbi:MAG: ABC transporter ATP-binding protein, partial [Selenomonadaceae bacterium]|nr:ABC transporter ATP-binding protein [Selenomonadaceae bacterium]
MKNYRRLLRYIYPYKKRLVLAIFCIIMAAGANLYLPWIIKDMIDEVLIEKNMLLLNIISVSIVGVFLLRGLFYYGQSYLVSYIGQRVVIDVREVMFRKFQRMPMAYFDKHQTGETMSYLTNDVNAIQTALVDNLIELVTEGAILIGSLAMMVYLDWKLSLLTLTVIPMVGQAMKVFGRKLKRTGTVIQERLADITSLLQESISSIRVVKSFVREAYEIERFQKQNMLN